jgi:hypothetical protein
MTISSRQKEVPTSLPAARANCVYSGHRVHGPQAQILALGCGRVLKAAKSKKLTSRLIMTDKAAQSFFAGVERDSEGVLESNPS